MNQYMICTDLDGTLLHHDGNPSSDTIAYLNELQKQGHIVVIATGRMYASARQFANLFHEDTCIICSNGAYAGTSTETIFQNGFTIEQVEQLHSIAKNASLSLYFFSKQDVYYTKNEPTFMGTEDQQRLSSGTDGALYSIKDKATAVKNYNAYVNGIIIEEVDFHKLLEVRPLLEQIEGLSISTSCFNNIEITPLHSDKGTAVHSLRDHYHLQNHQIIALGDGENDISMLKAAGISFAMQNASQIVKDEATYITAKSNEEDGVMHALQDYFFNM